VIVTRIFISFASSASAIADRLLEDLTAGGASVFQFRGTARAGQSAWTQVYDSIHDSEWFLVLLSREAVKSKPVEKEIGYADYRNTNDPQGRPILVPLLVEDLDPSKWPPPLQPLTPLDFRSYEDALPLLLKQLGLEGDSVVTEADGHGARPAEDGAELAADLSASPATAVAPADVEWTAEVRNTGTTYFTSVTAILDGRVLDDPFPLDSGSSRQWSKESRYTAEGMKTRTLEVRAVTLSGVHLMRRAKDTVQVQVEPWKSGLIDQLLKPNPSWSRPDPSWSGPGGDGQETSDAEVRHNLDHPGFPWGAVLYPALTLALGVGGAVGAAILVGLGLEALPAGVFTFLEPFTEWIARTVWIQWGSAALAAAVVGVSAWWIMDEMIPVDAGDYVFGTLKTTVVAMLVGSIWAVGHVHSFSTDMLAGFVAGAVLLGTVLVAAYAVLDEI
jgi:hypothetical protein